jgi:hypothetical protein
MTAPVEDQLQAFATALLEDVPVATADLVTARPAPAIAEEVRSGWQSSPWRGPAIAAAVFVFVLLVALIAVIVESSSSDPISPPPPTTETMVTWTAVSLAELPAPIAMPNAELVSNGSSLLLGSPEGELWRSDDGIEWEVATPPPGSDPRRLVGVNGGYLMATAGLSTMPCPSGCKAWISEDGSEWSLVSTAMDRAFDLQGPLWHVAGPDRMTNVDPLNPIYDYRGLVTVMEFGGSYVTFVDSGFSPPAASTSNDGRTWTDLSAPPMADSSTRMLWSDTSLGNTLCGIGWRPGQALALLRTGEKSLRLWSTSNGTTWQELPFDHELAPQANSEYQGVCLHTLGELWVITLQGAPIDPGDPSTHLLVSTDGNSWDPIELPPGHASQETTVRIAGNTIILIDAGSETGLIGSVSP